MNIVYTACLLLGLISCKHNGPVNSNYEQRPSGTGFTYRSPDFTEEEYLKFTLGLPEFIKAREIAEKSSHPYPKVAVFDSGLDLDMAKTEGLVFSPSSLDQYNLAPGNRPEMFDDLSHGTGIYLQLTALKNDFGMVGLIPDAQVIPIKVGYLWELQHESVPFSRLEAAFRLAKGAGVKIINMSLSNLASQWPEEGMRKLLQQYEEDILLVVSAGNDKKVLDYGKNCRLVPVCLNTPNLLKVGAKKYSDGNTGTAIDLYAWSEVYQWRIEQPQIRNEKDFRPERKYQLQEVWSTSHAAPLVTATLAMLLKLRPDLRPKELKSILIKSLDGDQINPIRVLTLK